MPAANGLINPMPEADRQLRRPLRDKHYALFLLVVFPIVSVLACVFVLPPEWPLFARVLAGVFGGLGSALCVMANRLLG